MFSTTAVTSAYRDGLAEGRTAERARIREILGAPAARGRALTAAALAFETDAPASEALDALAVAPLEGQR